VPRTKLCKSRARGKQRSAAENNPALTPQFISTTRKSNNSFWRASNRSSKTYEKSQYKKASSLCNRDEAILRVTTLLVEMKTIQPLEKYICKNRMCNSISFLPKFAPTTLSLFNCLETIYFSFSDKILNFNDTTEYTLFAVRLSIVFFILNYL